jgi:spore coat protein H
MRRLITPILFILLTVSASPGQIPEFKLTMKPADRDSLFTRDAFSNKSLPATFEAGGTVWKEIEVRFKGRSNRFFPKKSYRVKFGAKQLFNGVHQINLHAMYTDKSFLREKLSWDFFAEIGALAPGASYARLTLNEKPQGLYLRVDRIDKDFLKGHRRPPGELYNAGGYYSLADMTLQSGELLKLYYPKEIGDEDDYRDLEALLHAINDTPDSLFAEMLGRLFDINSVYNWLAGNIVLAMGDSYNKNYYLYHDPSRQSQQWTIIPWDYDETFGLSGDLAIPYPASLLNDGFEYTFPLLAGPPNVLKERLWKNPMLRAQLTQRVDSFLRTVFTEEHMFPRIDSLAALIREAVNEDTAKWGTYQDFLDNVETVKHFVTARRNFLLKILPGVPSVVEYAATLSTTQTGVPYHFVGSDGALVATMRFTAMHGLDSMRVEAFPDSLPPDVKPSKAARCVRRWLRVTPLPASATFTASLQWPYEDAASTDREVGKAVHNERALRCFYNSRHSWISLPSAINPFANVATVDSVTEKQCGGDNYFVLFMP